MYRKFCNSLLVSAFLLGTGTAQRPPGILEDRAPAPPSDRIEVRFALGEKPLLCESFNVKVKSHGRVLLDGSFSGGFTIPDKVKALPLKNALDIVLNCGQNQWHFRHAGERVFLRGWWWVGTDYPPFQWDLKDPRFEDAAWVQYLIVDPSYDSGFYLYNQCPAKLQNKNPGPCHPGK